MLQQRLFSFLSITLGLITFLFVSQQIKWLPFLHFTESNRIFYLLFLIFGTLIVGAVFFYWKQLSFSWVVEKILLLFLPTEIFIAFGFTQSHNFHYIFDMLMGAYILIAGGLAITLYIQRHRHAHEPELSHEAERSWFARQGTWFLMAVLGITIFFFASGLSNLTKYAAVDEPLWTNGRIAHYWHNVEDRDWKGTRISDKPGITIALAAGPGLWFVTPKEYRAVRHEGEVLNARRDIENFYLAFRLPLLIVITLLLPFFYFLIERLLGKKMALVSYAFIGLSPPLVGMSKIVNPDSLLWLLAPLSLLAYLVYRKKRLYRYLILAGIFMGLALLTKYVANIVFVFIFGLIFWEWVTHEHEQGEPLAHYIKRSFAELGILTFTALGLFYVLFPAVWVKPEKLVTSTLFSQAFEQVAPLFIGLLIYIFIDIRWNKTRTLAWIMDFLIKIRRPFIYGIVALFFLSTIFVLINVAWGMRWYDFVELLAAPKTISGKSGMLGIFLTNFYPLLFGVTPIVLAGLILGNLLPLRKDAEGTLAGRVSFALMLFILLYFLGGATSGVAMITRYQIMLFPLAALLAGIGWVSLAHLLAQKYSFSDSTKILFQSSVFTLFLLFSFMTLLTTPFPLSYASSLLPRAYHIDVKDMGPGSYEAAQWLNTQPNAQDILIWTDKDGVCKFFVGRCKRGFGNFDSLRKDGLDYVVVSSGRGSRTAKMLAGAIAVADPTIIRFDQYYGKTDPAFQILINDRPGHYVKVFKFQE